jgi:O-antigen/teichoic acid export membrane protein
VVDAIAYQLLIAKGSERLVLLSTIVASGMQASANLIFIPWWGIQGAVFGMFVLIVVVGIFYLYGARRELNALSAGLVLYSLFLTVSGWLVVESSMEILQRVMVGFGLWILASFSLLYADRRMVLKLSDLGYGITDERRF